MNPFAHFLNCGGGERRGERLERDDEPRLKERNPAEIVARCRLRSLSVPDRGGPSIDRGDGVTRGNVVISRNARVTYQAVECAHHRSVTESDRDRADAHELRRRETRRGQRSVRRRRDISRCVGWSAHEAVSTYRSEAALASVRPTRHFQMLSFDSGAALRPRVGMACRDDRTSLVKAKHEVCKTGEKGDIIFLPTTFCRDCSPVRISSSGRFELRGL